MSWGRPTSILFPFQDNRTDNWTKTGSDHCVVSSKVWSIYLLILCAVPKLQFSCRCEQSWDSKLSSFDILLTQQLAGPMFGSSPETPDSGDVQNQEQFPRFPPTFVLREASTAAGEPTRLPKLKLGWVYELKSLFVWTFSFFSFSNLLFCFSFPFRQLQNVPDMRIRNPRLFCQDSVFSRKIDLEKIAILLSYLQRGIDLPSPTFSLRQKSLTDSSSSFRSV